MHFIGLQRPVLIGDRGAGELPRLELGKRGALEGGERRARHELHGIGFAAVLGLVTMLIVMPLLFKVNRGVKPAPAEKPTRVRT